MKTLKTILIALMALTGMTLAGCNDLNEGIVLPTNSYEIDIDHFASQNFFDMTESGSITVNVKSPFTTTMLSTGEIDVENTARASGRFVLSPGTIPGCSVNGRTVSMTRDITVFVQPFELQQIAGYEPFRYPIRIRQRGTDGTIYLSAQEIRDWNEDHSAANDWNGKPNQRYVLASVKRMSDLHHETGIAHPDSKPAPMWYVPATRQYYGEARQLEARDLVLDVDGEELTVKVHYPAEYHLVKNLPLRIGDLVELNIPNSGMIAGDNTLWVSPLDILVR